MAKGLYFYKLVSPYEEDVTKNCKLTVNEIDSNFLTLKDEDIKSAELDEENYAVILTRNNGDKLVVDLTPILSGSVYDLKIDFENPSDSGACDGAKLYVTFSTLTSGDVKTTKTVPITGLVTTENINTVLGGGLLSRVITDGSLSGKGTIDSPLGIKSTEKDRPAVRLIDKTKGEELPEAFTNGTRYITKEYTSEFGYLYNFYAAEEINEKLKEEGRGWRIPSKADWDCLLNSIEPCDYRDHDSAICHQVLGKYAGTKLKSECGWLEEPDCECKITKPMSGQYCPDGDTDSEDEEELDAFDADDSVVDPNDKEPETVRQPYWGTDEFGMRILPTGYGDGDEIEHYFNKKTVFWTTTHVYNDLAQDLYVKEFDWNKSGVIQEAQCPDALFSIRLVKDFTGDNHFDTETIDGDNYRTILFPECGTIWTASNFAGTNYKHSEANMGLNPYNRIVYYINVWNGKEWEKRALEEGESVVIMEGNPYCQYNIEYRVYTEDDCNQILVNVDDTVVERVLERVITLIDEEREERISADTELWEALNAEISARTEADAEEKAEREAADQILQEEIEAEIIRAQDVEQQLWDAIAQEAEAREEVDQQLWEAIAEEASARTDVDNQLWEAISEEASARTDVDNQLWEAIAEEASARTDVDNQLWNAISEEASARTDVDNQLWNAIAQEASARTDVDNQLWEAIAEEARIREEIDNQQWDAINDEIARAKEEEARIECQIIDNPSDPMNDATATATKTIDGTAYYILNVNGGLTFYSKCGTNDIPIRLNADFGSF
jgi:hypothetical protein